MEEDIKILEDMLNKESSIYKRNRRGNKEIKFEVNSNYYNAIENLLTRYKQYEQKLMFALSPTTHELALETQRNFKKIIVQNIDEDTYTIRRELKKYWDNKDTYWKEE